MARSVKANYLFNLINSASQLLFPLITFPYASRIMMADGIGQVNFFQSIISYISLFTCLGIPMYAIREIAKVRDNLEKMTRTTVEILLLHAFLTLFGYIIVAAICMTVAKVQTDIPLFLILSVSIFFTAIGCEWFYQGIEDFKYVAIRGIVVKTVSVLLLFLLVKSKEDILWYGAYTVFGVLGGNIFNFIRLRKYLHRDFVGFSKLHPFKHLKPALHIFVFNVIASIYLQLNNVLLGFMKDAEAVGYFTAATKLMVIAVGLSSALGTVMMPRTSNLVAENKMNEFILVLCGVNFTPAILTSQIIALNVLMIGVSNVLGMQILYPMNQINIVILSISIGAITNLLLNLILIPRYGHNGTAIAYMLAETLVSISMFCFGRKYIPVHIFKKEYFHYIIGGFFMSICLYFSSLLPLGNFTKLVIMFMLGGMVYMFLLFWLSNPVGMMVWNTLAKVMRNLMHY